ncbi:hypothetical protein NE237_022316 [Protea cynaroides]|uniref:Uncharacterized protein n=1 Tax=Protea cynaroides TaxID=273540 RepID=A0A9Q0H9H7_9MAGN|nr:hypothetical protein NE237_022316 [Protea cynaroides]
MRQECHYQTCFHSCEGFEDHGPVFSQFSNILGKCMDLVQRIMVLNIQIVICFKDLNILLKKLIDLLGGAGHDQNCKSGSRSLEMKLRIFFKICREGLGSFLF